MGVGMSDQSLELATIQVREACKKPLRVQVQTFFDKATFTAVMSLRIRRVAWRDHR